MSTNGDCGDCPALLTLIQRTERAVATPGGDPAVAASVAEALRPVLHRFDLLTPEQRVPDPAHYRQHVLYADPQDRFSIVALVWLPGQATPVHDHVTWCVFGVHQGEEYEVQYELGRAGTQDVLLPVGETSNPEGSITALVPPGDIHYVINRGTGLAISIHIYGANIAQRGTSVRRRYDLPVYPPLTIGRPLPIPLPR